MNPHPSLLTPHLQSMTPKRRAKFERTVTRRQFDLTVILENVHDPHNIGAVLRSCDSVGIREVFVLYNEAHLQKDFLELGINATAGTRKWIYINYYTDTEACFAAVRRSYELLYATHLGQDSVDLYQLDLTQSVALLFDNEKDGLTAEAMTHADGNFIIPQVGMAKSLNISVACAVSLYEAYRQRSLNGNYTGQDLEESQRSSLLSKYLDLHDADSVGYKIPRIDTENSDS